MNSVETLNLYNEALNNEGTASIRTDEEIAKYGPGADRDLYPDTDWLGTMLRNHTYNMRYTLNVRGGTERARYPAPSIRKMVYSRISAMTMITISD